MLARVGLHVEQLAGIVEPILLRADADLAVPVREDHAVGPVACLASPVSSGLRLMPSSGLPADDRNPGQIRQRRQQVDRAGDLRDALAGGMCPGQRIKNGERTPPSSVEPLRPFMPPFQRQPFGPLSLK